MPQKMGCLMFLGVLSLCFGRTKTHLLPKKGEGIPLVWNENDVEKLKL